MFHNTLDIADVFGAKIFRCGSTGELLRLTVNDKAIERWSSYLNKWILNLVQVDPDNLKTLYEINLENKVGRNTTIDELKHQLTNELNLGADHFSVEFKEEILHNGDLLAVVAIRFKDKAILRDGEFLMFRE